MSSQRFHFCFETSTLDISLGGQRSFTPTLPRVRRTSRDSLRSLQCGLALKRRGFLQGDSQRLRFRFWDSVPTNFQPEIGRARESERVSELRPEIGRNNSLRSLQCGLDQVGNLPPTFRSEPHRGRVLTFWAGFPTGAMLDPSRALRVNLGMAQKSILVDSKDKLGRRKSQL